MFVFTFGDLMTIAAVALLVVLAVIGWLAGVAFETRRRKKS